YLLGGMGGGDVKLMMALGAILGPVSVFWVFVYACLVGGVMAIGVIIASGRWRLLAADWLLPLGIAVSYSRVQIPAQQTIPYGVAIAAGVVIFIFRGVI
ncbi:MAG: prepilin peptidase, partial [Methylocystaceae bacterium]